MFIDKLSVVLREDVRGPAWEHADEIAALYHKGISIEKLAAQFKTSRSSIDGILSYKGVVRRRPGKPRGGIWKHADEVMALYNGGMGADEIGRKFGAGRNSVLDIVRERGTVRPGSVGNTPAISGDELDGVLGILEKDVWPTINDWSAALSISIPQLLKLLSKLNKIKSKR